jgi:peptidoglycan/LPS O-acetylase OafA/YrhL
MNDMTTVVGSTQLAAHRTASSSGRLLFVDNVRWAVILLVVSMHAADTYSPLGNWYFVDRVPVSVPTLLTFAVWQMYLQAFFMGLLFLLAGVFLPGSLARKGSLGLIAERSFRLGAPVLLYMFVLGPITEYFVAHSWTSTEPTSFSHEWVKHVRNGEFLQENGPLWFCLALLIFSLVYVAWRQLSPQSALEPEKAATPGTLTLVGFAAAMAVGTFLVGGALPGDAVFLNMHLHDFPQYVLMFVAGIAAGRHQWLTRLEGRMGIWWVATVVPVGFVCWLAILVGGGVVAPGGGVKLSGWHWQAAAMDLWQAYTCVALSLGMLTFFRARLDSQGPVARFLSANAFSVYVFHPPILIAAARLLSAVHGPPLLKFVSLTVVAAVASFVLSATVFRRIPGLRAML